MSVYYLCVESQKDERQTALYDELRAELDLAEFPERAIHRGRMVSLLESQSAAFSRYSYEPGHFTASAFVLSRDFSRLLLVRHRKLGMWLQPGGHIEPTDGDLVAAARRELREETGLVDVKLVAQNFDLDVHEIPAWATTPRHLHFDVRTLFAALSEVVVAADDADDARWFDLKELLESERLLPGGLSTDESVRRVARRLVLNPPRAPALR